MTAAGGKWLGMFAAAAIIAAPAPGQIVPDKERTAAVAQVVDFTGLELFPAQTAFQVRQIVHREFLIIAEAC